MVPSRQLARKQNVSADEIDLTPFEFISSNECLLADGKKSGCAGCHPGGGPLEMDRNGLRYDRHLAEHPELAQSLDGDYHNSQWDKTGVVEADCFICHLPSYNKFARDESFKKLNYKWATVAGSRIGQVYGHVIDGETPKVQYNRRFFNEDGRIELGLSRRPAARNCLQCHGYIDMAKRGTTWDDPQNPDVHQLAGLTCVDCHFTNKDHNMAKADAFASTVRDDLDNTMRTCRDCHTTGYMGAPRLRHLTIRADHLDKISCAGCHIPFLRRAATESMVVTNGDAIKYVKYTGRGIGDPALWRPKFQRNKTGLLVPVNPVLEVLFTNRDENGVDYPLFKKEVNDAYTRVKHRLIAPDPLKIEVYKPEDISLMLSTLTSLLEKKRHYKKIAVGYHKGGLVYRLDEGGRLTAEQDKTWVSYGLRFNVSHNVAPAEEALGAGGCGDCHSEKSPIFQGMVITDLFGPDGRVEMVSSSEVLGYPGSALTVNNIFHKYLLFLAPYLLSGLLVLVFFLLLHFMTLDDVQYPAWFSRDISLNILNKRANLIRLSIFLVFVFAAHVFIFISKGTLTIFFSIYHKVAVFAGLIGFFVLLGSMVVFFIWCRRERLKAGSHSKSRRLGVESLYRLERLTRLERGAFYLIIVSVALMLVSGLLLFWKEKLSLAMTFLSFFVHGMTGIVVVLAVVGYLFINLRIGRILASQAADREEYKAELRTGYRQPG